MDFIRQLAMTNSVVEPRRCSKALPKAKLVPPKVHGHIWWSAACLLHCSFLNPRETITSEKYAQQIDETHLKLESLQLTLVNRRGPILLPDHTRRHVALHHVHLTPLVNRLPFIQASRQLFEGKVLPQPRGGIKFFPRVHWIPNYGFLCYRNKKTYSL